MIVCPNCSHQNPDGAIQCEACYTPLPSMVTCYSCGASVQSDASFCGQCGANLNGNNSPTASRPESTPSVGAVPDPTYSKSPESISSDVDSISIPDVTVPDLVEFDPLLEPEPLTADVPELVNASAPDAPAPISHEKPDANSMQSGEPDSFSAPPLPSSDASYPEPPDSLSSLSEATPPSPSATPSPPTFNATQIQTQSVQLLHTESNAIVEVPPHLTVVHIGKPNDRVPPDIDVSGFKDSEVVSRVHADIRVEGDSYYIEDVGSSNGTYINNIPLAPGNRHKLRSGDRIALGKGDKVSFIIQIT